MPEVHWATAPVEWRVIAFGLAVALAAGAVAGLVPALQSLSVDLANSLKSGVGDDTSHRSRIRSSLIVVQAALSVVLLVGAGFVRAKPEQRGITRHRLRDRSSRVRVAADRRGRLGG